VNTKRKLSIAAVAACGVALTLAAAAWAFSHDYAGHTREQPNATVKFTLVQRPGHGEFVKPFSFNHVRLSCSLGPSHITIDHGSFRRIPVFDDAFAKTKHHTDVGAQVVGHLVTGGRAHGRLIVNEDAAVCTSGTLHWHAERQP
jgi:hypothetical protein